MTIGLNLVNEVSAPEKITLRSLGDVKQTLRRAGVRPTKQRIGLMTILAHGPGHITAKMLHSAAVQSGVLVSLATVYNTLHHLRKVGILRSVPVDSSIIFYEINSSRHHHFFLGDQSELVDIPPGAMTLEKLPPTPEGFVVVGVEVLVKLRRKQGDACKAFGAPRDMLG